MLRKLTRIRNRDHRLGLGCSHFFCDKCQMPSTNNEKWVSEHPEDRGGFVYFPGSSMAGEIEINGSMRSYGGMTTRDCFHLYTQKWIRRSRVVAVDWLITLHHRKNPGMGLFFLLLSYYVKSFVPFWNHGYRNEEGQKEDWRKELSLHEPSNKDGSWVNNNGRWWERDHSLPPMHC